MKAFNKRKHKGVKKYKSYTHLEIGYENCEYWTIPLKFVKIKTEDGYIKSITIDMDKVELDKWFYKTAELRLRRLTEGANDITNVQLIRIVKNRNYNSWGNEPSQLIPMKDYLEANPYGGYNDNLLQSTEFDRQNLIYSWILDENIEIEYPYNWEKGSIRIPSKYSEIIGKLDREIWNIKELTEM